MRQPWQVWTLFLASLALVLAAVGWMSFKALDADRAEARARQQAEVEENARLALWRMDSAVAPLIAQESARPYFLYEAFYSADQAWGRGASKSRSRLVASPLLTQTRPEVLLYFQFDPDGDASSPQLPRPGLTLPSAAPFSTAVASAALKELLDDVRAHLAPRELLAQLPSGEALPIDRPREVIVAQQQQQQQKPNRQRRQMQQVASDEQLAAMNQDLQQQFDVQQTQRAASEYQARSQYVAQSSIANTKALAQNASVAHGVQTAIMTPRWIDNRLYLLRKVDVSGRQYLQGCVLDWTRIRQQLLDATGDLLPTADVVPVTAPAQAQARLMAALPVALKLGDLPAQAATGLSPVQLSLLIAWTALLAAVAAAGGLLGGVISLSERRAAFVSAVTHELRTPLTTFRMYAEMLSEDMVPDEQSRHSYLSTLRIEADRLTHLVENVLAYARLERGRPGKRVAPVPLGELLAASENRLAERARQGGLELQVGLDPSMAGRSAMADPAAVEQILFNLVDNACKYAATAKDRRLHLDASANEQYVRLEVRDHGPGIAPSQRRLVFQPFRKSAEQAARSAPGVGLGLALSRRLARDMGGELRYKDDAADGVAFVLELRAS